MSRSKHTKTQYFIDQLTYWSKKPSLDIEINEILDVYHSIINKEEPNFAEAALFVQGCSVIIEKQIDLVYKSFLQLHTNLCEVFRNKDNNQEKNENSTPVNIQTATSSNEEAKEQKIKNKKKRKCAEPIVENPPANVNSEDSVVVEIPENLPISIPDNVPLSIPGIPDELISKLNLSDCMLGGPINELIDKLDSTHPLHSLFTILGHEISKTKDIYTYNNLSLSGMSWNTLYKIEELLRHKQSKNNENNDLNLTEKELLNNYLGENLDDRSCSPLNNDNIDDNCNNTLKYNLKDCSVRLERLPEIKKSEEKKPDCVIKELRVNLLRLSYSLLTKKFHFKLPAEYFENKTATRISQRLLNKKDKNPKAILNSSKRKREIKSVTSNNLMKNIKSFDLESFEEFCFSYYESQGITMPRRDIACSERKSIDNRSDISYGYPVTPDSGRFSMSFHTDSEFEHLDEVENELHESEFCRADSGLEMSLSHDNHADSGVFSQEEDTPVDPTLQALKNLFPNTFSDPERAEVLKELYVQKQPEDDANYVEWKKFIEEKTANEKDFNIHEYGSDILNSFSVNSTPEKNVSFQEVVKDKSVEDVARYFVSVLQLANTYNVEIQDECPGIVKQDNLKLRFISNDRPHEELESFHVPSEEQFFNSLGSQDKNIFHSTPYHNIQKPSLRKTPIKRRRIDYSH